MIKNINTARAAISPMEARDIVRRSSGANDPIFRYQALRRSDNLYELEFVSDMMSYTCYVDAASGEMVGMDYEPCVA